MRVREQWRHCKLVPLKRSRMSMKSQNQMITDRRTKNMLSKWIQRNQVKINGPDAAGRKMVPRHVVTENKLKMIQMVGSRVWLNSNRVIGGRAHSKQLVKNWYDRRWRFLQMISSSWVMTEMENQTPMIHLSLVKVTWKTMEPVLHHGWNVAKFRNGWKRLFSISQVS